MKRILFVFTFIIIVSSSLRAQDKAANSTNISLGLEGSFPVGVFSNGYSFGIGGTFQVDHKISSKAALTLNTGFIYYSLKSTAIGSNLGIVPLLGGVKYYVSPQVYLNGQLGAAFSTNTGGGTFFEYSPGLGFVVSKNIDALIKYVGMSKAGGTLSSVGVRIAYTFGK